MPLGKVKIFDHLFESRKLPCQTWVVGFNQNYRLAKNLWFSECQFYDWLTVFWIFLNNYPAKSNITDLIDRTCCWKLTFVFCCVQFLLEKCFGHQKSTNFVMDRFLEIFQLLEKYRAYSHVQCSIEKPDFEILLYFAGHDLLLSDLRYKLQSKKVAAQIFPAEATTS